MTTEHHGVVTDVQSGIGLQMVWHTFEGPPSDGFGQYGTPSAFGETVLAFGHIDAYGKHHVCGSAFMVAPGVMVTATHVLEEVMGSSPIAMAYLPNNRLRLWKPLNRRTYRYQVESVAILGIERYRTHDICLVSCELISDAAVEHPLRMTPLEVSVPKVGERLWTLGHRQTGGTDEQSPAVALLGSSGLVTAVYPNGRGNHLPGPCVEVEMESIGGMSGGPVFNSDGCVVGLVSTSPATVDRAIPTFVSLIWPALAFDVKASWPPRFWPDSLIPGLSTLQVARRSGHASIRGNVCELPDGRLQVLPYHA